MSHYNYFYNFHNKPLAYDLYTAVLEKGAPPPPSSQQRITQDGQDRITEDGQERITE